MPTKMQNNDLTIRTSNSLPKINVEETMNQGPNNESTYIITIWKVMVMNPLQERF